MPLERFFFSGKQIIPKVAQHHRDPVGIEQLQPGAVDFYYAIIPVDGQIAGGGKIIKAAVFLEQYFELIARTDEFFVLQLEFVLHHLDLFEHPFDVIGI